MLFKKNLNKVIEVVNQLSEIVNNIDTNFEDIYMKIDNINAQIELLNNNFTIFEDRINQDVARQLQTFNNQVLSLLSDYQTIFDNNLLNLRTDLEAEIREIELGNVIAYDPTTRNIRKCFNCYYECL